MNPDHAKRVLEHQMKKTPRDIIAMWLGKSLSPSPLRLQEADRLIEQLIAAGYAIEPIEDDEPKSWDGPDGVIARAIKKAKDRDHED